MRATKQISSSEFIKSPSHCSVGSKTPSANMSFFSSQSTICNMPQASSSQSARSMLCARRTLFIVLVLHLDPESVSDHVSGHYLTHDLFNFAAAKGAEGITSISGCQAIFCRRRHQHRSHRVLSSRVHFLDKASRDLFICAKYLFVEAMAPKPLR